jgi:glycosidase
MKSQSILFKMLFGAVLLFGQPVTAQDPAQYGIPFAGVPDPEDAVIYQVNMRSFNTPRNFQGVISRLDYIRNLGVNVIYLMPIYEIGTLKAINSPYCVKDFLAVNPEFGTLSDLRTLVEEAHQKGMAVILDWVANHTSWDHDWISNPSWYEQDGSGNIIPPILGWTDVAQLDFNNEDMRNAMINAMKYWVFTANCDGFRFDYADGPPADFWKQAIDTLRNIHSHKLLLLAEGKRSDHFASGFNYTFGFKCYDQLKAIYGSNASVAGVQDIISSEYTNATGSNRVVHYTANHDVNSSGTPLDWFDGEAGSMAAFVATAYVKGVPMVYNGQEVGTPYPLHFLDTTTVINWNLHPDLVAEYTRIIEFYTGSNAIRKGGVTFHNTADVCAFEKAFENDTVFVVANLRNESKSYTLPAGTANRRKYDAFTDAAMDLGSTISLTAYEYRIFTDSGAVIPVTGVSISEQTDTITAIGSTQLSVTVSPENATYKSVTWESSNPDKATVTSTGLVQGISPGKAFIIVKTLNNGKKDSCDLTVTGTPVAGIVFDRDRDTVAGGSTLQIGYAIYPANATNRSVHWSSSDTYIASVNSTGIVKGIAEGSAFIYGETVDGRKRDTCQILVTKGTGFTVYFSKPETWANTIKIYYWDPRPAGILPVVYWPGVDMTPSGDWYKYTFTNISSTNLIFNDKTKQTGNLARNRDGWYKNDTWYDTNPDPAAISEEGFNHLFIYPNPVVEDHFTILLKPGEDHANMKLMDLQGRIVFETKLTAMQTSLNISLSENCVYIVSVTGDSNTRYQKIFVK